MYFILRYLVIFICVICLSDDLINCEDNVTNFQTFNNPIEHQIEKPNLSSLINLYKDYKNNLILIDDDFKYNRENQSVDETTDANATSINKSENMNFRPTSIDPIVPIIKRMIRRKDINRKDYPTNYEFKRRKGYSSSSNYNDDSNRISSNKIYNDDDDNHSAYMDGEEEDDEFYEDENYAKKNLAYSPHTNHNNGWSHASIAALPINDHHYTGSTGVPSYWNNWNHWNHWNHGHYYPYYAQHLPMHHGYHHHISKYGKHLYREEYAIILVVISLAAFLGLIFSLFMPYALIQSSALTGVPGNSVPYTNAVTTLNGNQFSNAAVTSDVNRIPINVFSTGKRRKKRMIRYDENQFLIDQFKMRNNKFDKLIRRLEDDEQMIPFIYNANLFGQQILRLAVRTTIDLLNNS